MDTELLKTFLEVRKTRHFGRAAQNLYITQAAVSARIKQLEESLGATLFIRKRNNIQLSSEGERLVPHAQMMLLDRTLDMAILFEPPSLPELSIVCVGELKLKLYSSRSGVSVPDALQNDFIYLDWGGGFARFFDRRFGEKIAPALHTNMSFLASHFLASKGGACFLPESYGASLANEGLTLVEGAPEYKSQLNIAYHSGSSKRELIDSVVGSFEGVTV